MNRIRIWKRAKWSGMYLRVWPSYPTVSFQFIVSKDALTLSLGVWIAAIDLWLTWNGSPSD